MDKKGKNAKATKAPKSKEKDTKSSKTSKKNISGGFELNLANLAALHKQNVVKEVLSKAGTTDDDDDLELVDSSRSHNFHDEVSQISKMHSQKLIQKLMR